MKSPEQNKPGVATPKATEFSIRRGSIAALLGGVALLNWVLWLAYTDNTGYREAIAGAIAAAIATTGAVVFAMAGNVHFRFRLRDLVQVYRVPWDALEGTWIAIRCVGRQLLAREGASGVVAAALFGTVADDPASAGRRALAITYTTITPKIVVLGVVGDQKLLLYHQIFPGPPPTAPAAPQSQEGHP